LTLPLSRIRFYAYEKEKRKIVCTVDVPLIEKKHVEIGVGEKREKFSRMREDLIVLVVYGADIFFSSFTFMPLSHPQKKEATLLLSSCEKKCVSLSNVLWHKNKD